MSTTAVPADRVLAGRYRLGPVLGRGGMADVFRATDTVLGREVAVKLFHPGVDDVDRTSDEVRLLASLDHPGLVGLHDAGTTDDGAPYLVMQLVDGPTLRDCCLDGSLSPQRAAQVGADLAEALAHCHARGVVHRDVKPANVLLDPHGRARLTDFGIARLVDAARRTATGLTLGTAPYFSPEQVRGGDVGPPTDVYSLGLVLLEALTGRREYAEADPVACAVARLSRPPSVPDDRAVGWPVGTADLLRRMTSQEPADRPTAADAAAELRRLAVDLPVPAATPVEATRALTTALPVEAAPATGTAAPGTAAPPVPTPETAGPGRSWRDRAGDVLGDDPAGRVMAVALLAALLLVATLGAWSAVTSSTPSTRTPIERLEEAVQP